MRALARGLLHDEHAADDVVQEAWLRAQASPPREARSADSVRAWLARVARTLALRERRGDARRSRREEHAARAEELASTVDVVAERQVLRSVVEAVLALDEPYQTVVVMRYYEELPPREIARRTGAPVGTVKSQLARALKMLRGRLDGSFGGDRRVWSLALAAVVRPPLAPVASAPAVDRDAPTELASAELAPAGSAMTRVAGFAFPAAALAGAGVLWLGGPVTADERSPVAAESEGTADTTTAAVAAAGAGLDDEASASGRTALGPEDGAAAPGERVVASESEPIPEPFVVSGLVLDRDDAPFVGADVYVAHPGGALQKIGATGLDGRFRISVPPPGAIVEQPEEVPVAVETVVGEVSFMTRRDAAGVIAPIDPVAPVPPLIQERVPAAGEIEAIVEEVPATNGVAVAPIRAEAVFEEPVRAHTVEMTTPPRWVDPPASVEIVFGVEKSRTWAALHRLEVRRDEPLDVQLAVRSYSTELLETFELELEERMGGDTNGVTWGDLEGLGIDPADYADPLPEDYFEAPLRASEEVVIEEVPAEEVVHGRFSVRGEVRLRSEPAAELHGVIVDENGEPARGALVFAEGARSKAWTRVDRTGAFVLRGLDAGAVRIHAGGGDLGRAAQTFELASGERASWSPTLDRGREVRGRLVDEAGTPLVGWTVELVGPQSSLFVDATRTSRDGRFAIPNAAVDPGRLFVRAPRDSWSMVPAAIFPDVRAGGAELELTLTSGERATGGIAVQLVWPQATEGHEGSGAPVTWAEAHQAEVRLWHVASGRGTWLVPTATLGEFAVPGLPRGEYRVVAGNRDWSLSAEIFARVEAGARSELELFLRPVESKR